MEILSLDRNIINDYLYFGYLPRKFNSDLINEVKEKVISPVKEEDLLDMAFFYLKRSFENSITRAGSFDNCLLPISGGWDSRFLLALSCENIERNKIKTVSFGCPGQLDFDIGCLIAKTMKLDHYELNLLDVELSWEKLKESVGYSPWTRVPDAFFNRLAVSSIHNNSKDILFSGFMGDPLTGGHLDTAKDVEQIYTNFLSKQRISKTFWLPESNYKPRDAVESIELSDNIPLSVALDVGIRQSNCILPIVTPNRDWNTWGSYMGRFPSMSVDVYSPFCDIDWVKLWLSIPNEYKVKQKLYLDLLKEKYFSFYCLPSKYSLGSTSKTGYLSRKVSRKILTLLDKYNGKHQLRYRSELNYLDFSYAFRYRDDYKSVLFAAIKYLKANDATPWLNLDSIVKEHMQGKNNHSNAFLTLIGLALNLENNPI